MPILYHGIDIESGTCDAAIVFIRFFKDECLRNVVLEDDEKKVSVHIYVKVSVYVLVFERIFGGCEMSPLIIDALAKGLVTEFGVMASLSCILKGLTSEIYIYVHNEVMSSSTYVCVYIDREQTYSCFKLVNAGQIKAVIIRGV